jgi:histidinol-phosphatase (PHP family)
MLFDTHMHTIFSTDSKMKIDEAISKGRENKIGITITEHMDLGYPEAKAFQFDVDEYLAMYNKFRNDDVLLGIEIGMRHDCLEDNRGLIQRAGLDFVIGSIHVIENIDIYHESFYCNHTKQYVYNQYFGAMLECMKCYDFIDSLGHIDYIARYARFSDPEIYYDEFADSIDAILKIVAEQEKALEINTRRITDRQSIELLMPIYKRFAELGGKLVTVGSDAHKPADVGRGLADGMAIAAACGLKAVYFKERQAYYAK